LTHSGHFYGQTAFLPVQIEKAEETQSETTTTYTQNRTAILGNKRKENLPSRTAGTNSTAD
jgi:hypothetical protein